VRDRGFRDESLIDYVTKVSFFARGIPRSVGFGRGALCDSYFNCGR
jgi:hypothetical protein